MPPMRTANLWGRLVLKNLDVEDVLPGCLKHYLTCIGERPDVARLVVDGRAVSLNVSASTTVFVGRHNVPFCHGNAFQEEE